MTSDQKRYVRYAFAGLTGAGCIIIGQSFGSATLSVGLVLATLGMGKWMQLALRH